MTEFDINKLTDKERDELAKKIIETTEEVSQAMTNRWASRTRT